MSRADELARSFELANEAFIQAVEACPDEKWTNPAANEERNVATIAHHVASGHMFIAERVQMVAAGGRPEPPDIDARNAEHARANPSPSKEETIALLRQKGAEAAAIYRQLDDEGLDRSIEVPERGTFSAEKMIEMVAIGHPQMHQQSLGG
jgi:uncharacterized damage-inducible protein DinB